MLLRYVSQKSNEKSTQNISHSVELNIVLILI